MCVLFAFLCVFLYVVFEGGLYIYVWSLCVCVCVWFLRICLLCVICVCLLCVLNFVGVVNLLCVCVGESWFLCMFFGFCSVCLFVFECVSVWV